MLKPISGTLCLDGQKLRYQVTREANPTISVDDGNGPLVLIPPKIVRAVVAHMASEHEIQRAKITTSSGNLGDIDELRLEICPKVAGFFCDDLVLLATQLVLLDNETQIDVPWFWQAISIEGGFYIAPADELIAYRVPDFENAGLVSEPLDFYEDLPFDRAGALATIFASRPKELAAAEAIDPNAEKIAENLIAVKEYYEKRWG